MGVITNVAPIMLIFTWLDFGKDPCKSFNEKLQIEQKYAFLNHWGLPNEGAWLSPRQNGGRRSVDRNRFGLIAPVVSVIGALFWYVSIVFMMIRIHHTSIRPKSAVLMYNSGKRFSQMPRVQFWWEEGAIFLVGHVTRVHAVRRGCNFTSWLYDEGTCGFLHVWGG